MKVPYEPIQWQTDVNYNRETQMGKPARIAQLIHAYRSRGHLVADTDPLSYRLRVHTLTSRFHKLRSNALGFGQEIPNNRLHGKSSLRLRNIIAYLRNTYTHTIGYEYMHIQDPTNVNGYKNT